MAVLGGVDETLLDEAVPDRPHACGGQPVQSKTAATSGFAANFSGLTSTNVYRPGETSETGQGRAGAESSRPNRPARPADSRSTPPPGRSPPARVDPVQADSRTRHGRGSSRTRRAPDSGVGQHATGCLEPAVHAPAADCRPRPGWWTPRPGQRSRSALRCPTAASRPHPQCPPAAPHR